MITGGAVSADGTVAAVRTYTDVYVFHAPDSDLVAAIAAGPVFRIPVPDEPQGEAMAFTDAGDLLTGSEAILRGGAATGELPPIRVFRGVADYFAADPGAEAESDPGSGDAGWIGAAAAVGSVVLIAAATLVWRLRARRT